MQLIPLCPAELLQDCRIIKMVLFYWNCWNFIKVKMYLQTCFIPIAFKHEIISNCDTRKKGSCEIYIYIKVTLLRQSKNTYFETFYYLLLWYIFKFHFSETCFLTGILNNNLLNLHIFIKEGESVQWTEVSWFVFFFVLFSEHLDDDCTQNSNATNKLPSPTTIIRSEKRKILD